MIGSIVQSIYCRRKCGHAQKKKKEDESFIHISPFNFKFLLKVEFLDKWIFKKSIFQVNISLPVVYSKVTQW